MEERKLGAIEAKFADIIWKNAPVTTAQLVKIGQQELNWKRTTTYTVLKRLCEKGLFQNDNGTVTILLSKEEFETEQSCRFVEETFHGSLPAFLAAFSRQSKLTPQEIEELQRLIEKSRG